MQITATGLSCGHIMIFMNTIYITFWYKKYQIKTQTKQNKTVGVNLVGLSFWFRRLHGVQINRILAYQCLYMPAS